MHLPLVVAGLGLLLPGCDQVGSDGHMMGGGMMMQGLPGKANHNPPEPLSDGAQLQQHFCGQCHVPPLPSVHTDDEWPPVLSRMRQHMVTQGMAVPNREQFEAITAYLQRNSR